MGTGSSISSVPWPLAAVCISHFVAESAQTTRKANQRPPDPVGITSDNAAVLSFSWEASELVLFFLPLSLLSLPFFLIVSGLLLVTLSMFRRLIRISSRAKQEMSS
jgi:hypothetical protein